MEKIEDIQNRMFTLKKRLRQTDMNEMFESGNKSIIEVYEKACKKNAFTSNIVNDGEDKNNEVKKNTPSIKV
jgi:hypothetical protein